MIVKEKIDFMIMSLKIAKEELEYAEKCKEENNTPFGRYDNYREPNATLIRENLKTVSRMSSIVSKEVTLTPYCSEYIGSSKERREEEMNIKVCWISAGVSSFIAGYLAENVDKFIYIDIDNQHPDSIRFIKDCERALGKEVEILKSPYGSVENIIRQFRYVNGAYGAKCTRVLKKRVRKEWEDKYKDYDITYVWGFDSNERHRAERLKETYPQFEHEFPLIDKNLSKQDTHAILERLNIKRPAMYDLGYSNNNCIGCVKGGMGYWNKIRVDFPEVFNRMATLEREIGNSCIKGVYLDELEPNRGRMDEEIMQECGIMCYLVIQEQEDIL